MMRKWAIAFGLVVLIGLVPLVLLVWDDARPRSASEDPWLANVQSPKPEPAPVPAEPEKEPPPAEKVDEAEHDPVEVRPDILPSPHIGSSEKVTLEGDVVVVDARGREHRSESGSFCLMLRSEKIGVAVRRWRCSRDAGAPRCRTVSSWVFAT